MGTNTKLAAILVALYAAIACTGCTTSSQSFRDFSFGLDEDGNLESGEVIEGESHTWAPPFSSKAVTNNNLKIEQKGDGWTIGMGSASQLDGGDVSTTLEQLNKLVLEIKSWTVPLPGPTF